MATEKAPRPKLTPEQKIAALKLKIAELEKKTRERARLKQVREGQAARKLRTRQIIILGAMLVDAADSGDEPARKLIGKYFANLTREQDKETLQPLIEALKAPKEPKPVS